jgi:hypothetical protein
MPTFARRSSNFVVTSLSTRRNIRVVAAVSISQEVGMMLAAGMTTVRVLVIGPLVGLLLAGCVKPRPATSTPTQRTLFEQVRQNYEVTGGKRPARDTTLPNYHGKSIPDDEAPMMWIETLKLKIRTPVVFAELLAVITSDGDYPLLGVQKGSNLVWRKVSDSTHWITPERPGAPNFPIVPDPLLYRKAMPNHEPGLLRVKVNSMAFVVCLDDCPSGHCISY